MGRHAKTKQKEMDFLFELLGDKANELGLDRESFETEIAFQPVETENRTLQAEGVLLFLQSAGKALQPKKCKHCGEVFSTRYINVGYCSDQCRARALSLMGIAWNPRTDHYQNLDAERPPVVTPEVHKVLVEFAERILAGNIQVQEVEPNPEEIPNLPEEPEILPQWPDFQPETDQQTDLPTSLNLSLPELDAPLEKSVDQSPPRKPLLDLGEFPSLDL